MKLQIAKRLQGNWGGSKRKTTLSSFWIQLQQNYLLSSWNVFLGLLVIWPIHQVVSFGEPACLFVWSVLKKNMLKEKFCKTYNILGWSGILYSQLKLHIKANTWSCYVLLKFFLFKCFAYWQCMSQLGTNG